jgi:molybdopterin-binding protein
MCAFIAQGANERARTMSTIGAINARNQFKGRIREIIPGPVLSEVDVETPAGIITSVITSRSLRDLDLQVGTEVLAVFKSTEVLLAKLD